MLKFLIRSQNFISPINPEKAYWKLLVFIKRNVQKYQKQFNKPILDSIPLLKQIACYKSMQKYFLAEFSEKKLPNIFCYFAFWTK